MVGALGMAWDGPGLFSVCRLPACVSGNETSRASHHAAPTQWQDASITSHPCRPDAMETTCREGDQIDGDGDEVLYSVVVSNDRPVMVASHRLDGSDYRHPDGMTVLQLRIVAHRLSCFFLPSFSIFNGVLVLLRGLRLSTTPSFLALVGRLLVSSRLVSPRLFKWFATSNTPVIRSIRQSINQTIQSINLPLLHSPHFS